MNTKLKDILKRVEFKKRFDNLFNKHSHRNLFRTNDPIIVQNSIRELGFSSKYFKNQKYHKVDLECPMTNLHLSTDLGIVEFILNVTIDGEEIGGPFGYLSTFIESSDTIKKPRFATYEELVEILQEGLQIYEDIKYELFHIEGLDYQKKEVQKRPFEKILDATEVDVIRKLIDSSSDERNFFSKPFDLLIEKKSYSILLENTKNLSSLEKITIDSVFKKFVNQVGAKRNILNEYISIEGHALKYIINNSFLIIISVGEVQPHLFKIFFEGAYKVPSSFDSSILS